MSKKILFTVTNDLTQDQRMIRICTTLTNQNYEVWLIGRQLAHSKPFVNQLFMQKRIKNYFNKGKLFYLEYNLRLLLYLWKQSFDIVCAIDLDTLLPAYLTALIKQKICVYDAHEYFTEVPELLGRTFSKRVWEALATFVIPKLQYCYTVGDCLAEVFEKKYNVPFKVIKNVPFSHPKTPNTTPPLPKVILYQGALNVGRGLENAILAMKEINNAVLWLAGEGDISQSLRQLVEKEQLTHKVKFLGFVLPAQLPAITAQATIGLNLLDNKSLSYYYSLANKFFDYIQQNIPQITMRFPEYERLCQEYDVAILLDDLTTSSISSALHTLLENSEKYQQLQSNSMIAAQVFNWEQEQQKLIQFYQQVIRKENLCESQERGQ